MQSLIDIEKQIIEHAPVSYRIVRGLWSVDCLYNPSNNGRVFDYKFLVSQTIGQGAAYSLNHDYSCEYLKGLIGYDFTTQAIDDIALKTCLLDSVYGEIFPAKNKVQCSFTGSSIDKLHWRTNIIINEAKRLIGSLKGKKVVNVGVVGDILYGFYKEGTMIVGTDYDPDLIGSKFMDTVPILDGKNTLSAIKDSDLAIITGMTITTGTIDDIISIANSHNTKIIVFAETGANLASYYINKGVHSYLSEHFPFYIYNGHSVIDVCSI